MPPKKRVAAVRPQGQLGCEYTLLHFCTPRAATRATAGGARRAIVSERPPSGLVLMLSSGQIRLGPWDTHLGLMSTMGASCGFAGRHWTVSNPLCAFYNHKLKCGRRGERDLRQCYQASCTKLRCEAPALCDCSTGNPQKSLMSAER